MVLEKWQPGWGMRPWRSPVDEMESRLEELFGRPLFPMLWRQLPAEMRGWIPPIEMIEKNDRFVVRAELPGMKQEEIDVSVVGDTLSIRGERKAEKDVKKEDYHYCERSYGSFYRAISLPSAVDSKKIAANFDSGVLEVTLPKAAAIKPKKVAISAK